MKPHSQHSTETAESTEAIGLERRSSLVSSFTSPRALESSDKHYHSSQQEQHYPSDHHPSQQQPPPLSPSPSQQQQRQPPARALLYSHHDGLEPPLANRGNFLTANLSPDHEDPPQIRPSDDRRSSQNRLARDRNNGQRHHVPHHPSHTQKHHISGHAPIIRDQRWASPLTPLALDPEERRHIPETRRDRDLMMEDRPNDVQHRQSWNSRDHYLSGPESTSQRRDSYDQDIDLDMHNVETDRPGPLIGRPNIGSALVHRAAQYSRHHSPSYRSSIRGYPPPSSTNEYRRFVHHAHPHQYAELTYTPVYAGLHPVYIPANSYGPPAHRHAHPHQWPYPQGPPSPSRFSPTREYRAQELYPNRAYYGHRMHNRSERDVDRSDYYPSRLTSPSSSMSQVAATAPGLAALTSSTALDHGPVNPRKQLQQEEQQHKQQQQQPQLLSHQRQLVPQLPQQPGLEVEHQKQQHSRPTQASQPRHVSQQVRAVTQHSQISIHHPGSLREQQQSLSKQEMELGRQQTNKGSLDQDSDVIPVSEPSPGQIKHNSKYNQLELQSASADTLTHVLDQSTAPRSVRPINNPRDELTFSDRGRLVYNVPSLLPVESAQHLSGSGGRESRKLLSDIGSGDGHNNEDLYQRSTSPTGYAAEGRSARLPRKPIAQEEVDRQATSSSARTTSRASSPPPFNIENTIQRPGQRAIPQRVVGYPRFSGQNMSEAKFSSGGKGGEDEDARLTSQSRAKAHQFYQPPQDRRKQHRQHDEHNDDFGETEVDGYLRRARRSNWTVSRSHGDVSDSHSDTSGRDFAVIHGEERISAETSYHQHRPPIHATEWPPWRTDDIRQAVRKENPNNVQEVEHGSHSSLDSRESRPGIPTNSLAQNRKRSIPDDLGHGSEVHSTREPPFRRSKIIASEDANLVDVADGKNGGRSTMIMESRRQKAPSHEMTSLRSTGFKRHHRGTSLPPKLRLGRTLTPDESREQWSHQAPRLSQARGTSPMVSFLSLPKYHMAAAPENTAASSGTGAERQDMEPHEQRASEDGHSGLKLSVESKGGQHTVDSVSTSNTKCDNCAGGNTSGRVNLDSKSDINARLDSIMQPLRPFIPQDVNAVRSKDATPKAQLPPEKKSLDYGNSQEYRRKMIQEAICEWQQIGSIATVSVVEVDKVAGGSFLDPRTTVDVSCQTDLTVEDMRSYDEFKASSRSVEHRQQPISATPLLHGLPVDGSGVTQYGVTVPVMIIGQPAIGIVPSGRYMTMHQQQQQQQQQEQLLMQQPSQQASPSQQQQQPPPQYSFQPPPQHAVQQQQRQGDWNVPSSAEAIALASRPILNPVTPPIRGATDSGESGHSSHVHSPMSPLSPVHRMSQSSADATTVEYVGLIRHPPSTLAVTGAEPFYSQAGMISTSRFSSLHSDVVRPPATHSYEHLPARRSMSAVEQEQVRHQPLQSLPSLPASLHGNESRDARGLGIVRREAIEGGAWRQQSPDHYYAYVGKSPDEMIHPLMESGSLSTSAFSRRMSTGSTLTRNMQGSRQSTSMPTDASGDVIILGENDGMDAAEYEKNRRIAAAKQARIGEDGGSIGATDQRYQHRRPIQTRGVEDFGRGGYMDLDVVSPKSSGPIETSRASTSSSFRVGSSSKTAHSKVGRPSGSSSGISNSGNKSSGDGPGPTTTLTAKRKHLISTPSATTSRPLKSLGSGSSISRFRVSVPKQNPDVGGSGSGSVFSRPPVRVNQEAEMAKAAKPAPGFMTNVAVAAAAAALAASKGKKHPCPKCGKAFSRPSQLQTHMLTHTGGRPYVCTICDKAFNVVSNLKRHERTHSQEERNNSSRFTQVNSVASGSKSGASGDSGSSRSSSMAANPTSVVTAPATIMGVSTSTLDSLSAGSTINIIQQTVGEDDGEEGEEKEDEEEDEDDREEEEEDDEEEEGEGGVRGAQEEEDRNVNSVSVEAQTGSFVENNDGSDSVVAKPLAVGAEHLERERAIEFAAIVSSTITIAGMNATNFESEEPSSHLTARRSSNPALRSLVEEDVNMTEGGLDVELARVVEDEAMREDDELLT